MATQAPFEQAIELSDHKQLWRSIRLLLDEWVYLFILDTPGSNTPVSTDSVTYIIATGKNNPINMTCIDDGEDRLGVAFHLTARPILHEANTERSVLNRALCARS